MDKSDRQLAEILKQMLEAGTPGITVTAFPIEKELLSNIQPLPNPDSTTKTIEEQFFFTLVGMAQWALEHPSTSRFEYISPEEIKAIPNLKNAFMVWWYNDHPYIKPEQEKMFNQSIKDGLFPAAVMEHTADGHHPIGWSWGSEYYLADFYMCLTYAIIQRGIKMGKDVKDKFAPICIAKQVEQLNRVIPTVEIIDAMDERLNEPEPNATRPYSVISGETN
jgi:hypothetical protein